MKRTMIISAGTLTNDGYQSRIEMEMELLKEYFDFVIITSEKSKGASVSVPCKIVYYCVNKYSNKLLNIINNRRMFDKCLKQVIKEGFNPIIYCESLMPLLRSIKIAKRLSIPCIYDCHGIQPVEYRLYHPTFLGWVYSKLLAYKEERYVSKCDMIVTVTNRQYELWKCTTKHCTLPMIPSEVFLTTKKLKKSDAKEMVGIPADLTVFVYSGGTNKWQMCSETIELYSRIEKNMPDSFLLILSHDIATFENLTEKYGIKRKMIKSVDYCEMPKYLDACDYGFCIRQNSIINKVASPTKLLEYLARDVVPIMSDNIGEYSAMFKMKKLAIVVEDYKTFEFVSSSVNRGSDFVQKYKEEVVKRYIQCISEIQ